MKNFSISIITEVRVYKVNNLYYSDNPFSKILERYNFKFKNIKLITRIIESDEIPHGFVNISNFCKKIINIGNLLNFVLNSVDKNIINEILNSDLIIFRIPSLLSQKLIKYVKKYNKKYMVEVMGCVWDSYTNHGIITKLIAPYSLFKTKKIVYNADYAIYVTQKFLQNRYPCKNYNIGVSNVNIDCIYDVKEYKNFNIKDFTLMTAAAVNVKYKGQQYVIKAISKLKNKYNINVKYIIAGKGDSTYLKKIAKKYNVINNISFLGMLTHKEVIEEMKKVDIYVQPSSQEGLPRSLIEAMSCGDVCIGTNIAGIPELLEKPQLFKAKSVNSLLNCILNNVKNSNKFELMSKRNITKSKNYLNKELDKRRYEYFDLVLEGLKGDIENENKQK